MDGVLLLIRKRHHRPTSVRGRFGQTVHPVETDFGLVLSVRWVEEHACIFIAAALHRNAPVHQTVSCACGATGRVHLPLPHHIVSRDHDRSACGKTHSTLSDEVQLPQRPSPPFDDRYQSCGDRVLSSENQPCRQRSGRHRRRRDVPDLVNAFAPRAPGVRAPPGTSRRILHPIPRGGGTHRRRSCERWRNARAV